jgi:hypothetical protein
MNRKICNDVDGNARLCYNFVCKNFFGEENEILKFSHTYNLLGRKEYCP